MKKKKKEVSLKGNDHILNMECKICSHIGEWHKCCPKTFVSANGFEEINSLFGFRYIDGKLYVQSYCKKFVSGKRSD